MSALTASRLREFLYYKQRGLRKRLYYANFGEWAQLQLARLRCAREYQSEEEPLISVTIATWNRGKLLVERTLPSVFAQTYQNFEIVIVGDHCPDDTPERIARLNHPKVRFHNLPEQGRYPEEATARWRVAGCTPINKSLELAKGKWLAYLDDDDVYPPDHLEVLLKAAQARDYELVYGKYRWEVTPGVWQEGGSAPFEAGHIGHSGVLYRSYLRFFKYRIDSWKFNKSTDKDLWRRMALARVRAGFVDRVVVSAPLRPGEDERLSGESSARRPEYLQEQEEK